MRIAVCDDDHKVCADLKRNIYEYARIRKLDMGVNVYNSAIELLNDNVSQDLIFLDHRMPDMNGLDAAKALRLRNNYSTIVFLTNYSEIVYESFEVNTFRFMLKPLKKSELHKVLDAYYTPFLNKQSMNLKIDGEMRNIRIKDIIYIEADGKYSRINLIEESVFYKKTMSTVEMMLQGKLFCKSHRSFIVNLDYIERHDGERIFLKQGYEVPIGKKYAEDFKSAFMEHVKRNYV